MGRVRGEFLSRISLFGVSVLVLRMNVGNGSVSACALASCGGDVEERLGLPQLGPPLQVIYVGCGGFCIWTCSEMGGKNKAQQTKKVIGGTSVRRQWQCQRFHLSAGCCGEP